MSQGNLVFAYFYSRRNYSQLHSFHTAFNPGLYSVLAVARKSVIPHKTSL